MPAFLHALLVYLGLRAPAPTEAPCAACPIPVVLAAPHVAVTRQVETQTRAGRIHVQDADVAAVMHRTCARTRELILRRVPSRLAAELQPPYPDGTPWEAIAGAEGDDRG